MCHAISFQSSDNPSCHKQIPPSNQIYFHTPGRIASACTVLIISLSYILACAFCILAPAGLPLALDGFESESEWEREKRESVWAGDNIPLHFLPQEDLIRFRRLSDNWRFLRGDKNSLPAPLSLHHCPCVSLAPLGGVYSFKRSLERQTKLSLSSCATWTLQFASQINGLALDNALLVQNPLIRRPSYYCGCFICDSFAAGASAQRA